MSSPLLNVAMLDGSRQFGALPQSVLWHELRAHLAKLAGAALTDIVTDDVTEAWIDFTYAGHDFSVNDQFGEYWFFVDDPNCPNEVLRIVFLHCAELLR